MRVLILAQFYPPDLGGEERHARNLAVGLSRRGHEVEVITTALPAAGPGDQLEDGGVLVHRVSSSAQRLGLFHSDAARPHAAPIPDPAVRRAIAELLRRRRFDVVHAHNWIVNSGLGPARETGTPLVLTLHDYSHVCAVKRYVRLGHECEGPAAIRCAACAARHYGAGVGVATAAANTVSARARLHGVAAFIAVSRSVAERNRLPASDVAYRVIPNFIPDDLVREPEPLNGPLLFLGDLSDDKGIRVLLDAYRLLEDPPELLLVGRRVSDATLDFPPGVRHLGPRPHAEAMALLRRAGTLVLPSIVPDSCPTVVLEAMAAGRPVVASPRGGIVDLVVDGETGLLAEPEPRSLAAAIRDVSGDARRRKEMGAAALRRAPRFTASSVIPEIEALYEWCASGTPRRDRSKSDVLG